MVFSGKVIWNKKPCPFKLQQRTRHVVRGCGLVVIIEDINLIICVFVSEFINVVSRRETRARNGVRQTLEKF